jgi:hypothetical protein
VEEENDEYSSLWDILWNIKVSFPSFYSHSMFDEKSNGHFPNRVLHTFMCNNSSILNVTYMMGQ